MTLFLIMIWSFILLFVILVVLRLMKIRASTFIAVTGGISYLVILLYMIWDDDFTVIDCIWPAIFFLICAYFVYSGSKQVAFQTQAPVFDVISGLPIGVLGHGKHTTDPIFERVSASVDGLKNKSLDLQELPIKIDTTNPIHTGTRGIQAWVKGTSFVLHLHGPVARIFEIEGGTESIIGRIELFIPQYFEREIGQIPAVTLDQDKHRIIERLCRGLKSEVNAYCTRNRYPYQIVEEVTIADTELDKAFYDALAKKEIASLNQQALDVDANALIARLVAKGEELLPGTKYSHAEKIKAAQIALGIVKEEISFKKYGLDADTGNLAKAIAMIFKK